MEINTINYLPAEEPDAQEVINLIQEAGGTAVAIPGDITDPAFCRELVQKAVDGLGGLDILVNNAGFQQSAPSIEDIAEDTFDQTMKTNIYAPFWITKAALPHMEAGSSIIITASVVAESAPKNLFDYSQTKAANVLFAKTLSKQLAPRGIRVNAVAPGPFWTPLQVVGGPDRRAAAVWRRHAVGASRPAGGNRAALCPVGKCGVQLLDWAGLRGHGRLSRLA